ncbi:hypothetical protein PILCRDRAFT_11114 [Piloderma croceum F 1598]|uniref:Uncharacterized protein n=1 Tax=Piloderma croceum (strain F 1598) TaxID=765440 RepID=A0A0C3BN01_PILCF|nr:hypothetical protein PILCRDRAFT_11114 [Piloderma croceum F 1598]
MLTASLSLFSGYFPLDFGFLADRVFQLSTDEGTGVALAAPPPAANEDDNNDKAAVTGPRIQACVNLTKTITFNHRLTGPGKMVKLCLLFVGKSTNKSAIDIPNSPNCYY